VCVFYSRSGVLNALYNGQELRIEGLHATVAEHLCVTSKLFSYVKNCKPYEENMTVSVYSVQFLSPPGSYSPYLHSSSSYSSFPSFFLLVPFLEATARYNPWSPLLYI
jgi:hypothetical protein